MPSDKLSSPILNAPGKIRIVGGLWKRTPVPVPTLPGLRPTPDRVRESLFNWLGPSIEQASCLDLFAGSGALGLEALSRGAASVHFNEPHPKAAGQISALLARLQRPPGADWSVTRQDALALLQSLASGGGRKSENQAGFGLVFLDPPFHQDWLNKVLPVLLPQLNPGGRIYVEAEAPFEHPALKLQKSGKAGQVHYHLFQVRSQTQFI
jgi:16S rRNA (guanine966-N2)-methyltransferase